MARAVVALRDGASILLVDSITEIEAGDSGRIVVSGSHGGVSAAGYAAAVPLAACFLNDAGIGKDAAGIAGVLSLPYAAAAYRHDSARIGDAADAWANGVLSAVNAAAEQAGLRIGMTVRQAVEWLLRS